jgi:hypothetical protein
MSMYICVKDGWMDRSMCVYVKGGSTASLHTHGIEFRLDMRMRMPANVCTFV